MAKKIVTLFVFFIFIFSLGFTPISYSVQDYCQTEFSSNDRKESYFKKDISKVSVRKMNSRYENNTKLTQVSTKTTIPSVGISSSNTNVVVIVLKSIISPFVYLADVVTLFLPCSVKPHKWINLLWNRFHTFHQISKVIEGIVMAPVNFMSKHLFCANTKESSHKEESVVNDFTNKKKDQPLNLNWPYVVKETTVPPDSTHNSEEKITQGEKTVDAKLEKTKTIVKLKNDVIHSSLRVVRFASAKALLRLDSDKKELWTAFVMLNSEKVEERRKGAKSLGKFQDKTVVSALLCTLKSDSDGYVRGYAAEALATLNAVSAVPLLIQSLNNLPGKIECNKKIVNSFAAKALLLLLKDSIDHNVFKNVKDAIMSIPVANRSGSAKKLLRLAQNTFDKLSLNNSVHQEIDLDFVQSNLQDKLSFDKSKDDVKKNPKKEENEPLLIEQRKEIRKKMSGVFNYTKENISSLKKYIVQKYPVFFSGNTYEMDKQEKEKTIRLNNTPGRLFKLEKFVKQIKNKVRSIQMKNKFNKFAEFLKIKNNQLNKATGKVKKKVTPNHQMFLKEENIRKILLNKNSTKSDIEQAIMTALLFDGKLALDTYIRAFSTTGRRNPDSMSTDDKYSADDEFNAMYSSETYMDCVYGETGLHGKIREYYTEQEVVNYYLDSELFGTRLFEMQIPMLLLMFHPDGEISSHIDEWRIIFNKIKDKDALKIMKVYFEDEIKKQK